MRLARRALLVRHRNVAVIHQETTMTKTPKTSRTTKPRTRPPAKRAAPTKTTKAKPRAKRPAKADPKPTVSKQSQLIALLQSPTGATIEQMTRATGWQAHTIRGTISGSLRKRLGLVVTCGGEAGAGVYRIIAAA
jgi:cell division septation protein DedD